LETWIPTWRRLRRYGNNKAIKSSYFWVLAVPIVAKLVPQIENILSTTEYTIDLALPFSWKMFYFGSVLFAISTLIYSKRCPYLIQHYNTPNEYWNAGHGLRELDAYAEITLSDIDQDKKIGLFNKYLETSATLSPGVKSHTGADLNSKFFFVQEKTQNKRKWSRFACIAGYGIGSLFFVYVLVENFLYVLNHVVD
jgi:hypothetical protein